MKNFLKTAGRVLVCAAVGVTGAMVSGCGGASEFEIETLAHSEKTTFGWDSSVTVEFPVSGGDVLLDSVRTWIDSELKEYVGLIEECDPYDGALEDGRAMVDFFSEELVRLTSKDSDEGTEASLNADGGFPGESHFWITAVCASNKFVTYEKSYDLYTGGAHGSHGWSYATFRRDNGQPLGWDIFKNDAIAEVCALIETALDNDYFTEEYGEPYFANGETTWDGTLGLPQSLPGFTKDGIIFQYAEYELAPYSFGSPYCLIPYSTLLPYMTKSTRRLLK